MTYNVFSGTLNPTQSINQSQLTQVVLEKRPLNGCSVVVVVVHLVGK